MAAALQQLIIDGTVPAETTVSIQIDHARNKEHGDFACNLAMMLSKAAGMKPRDLAQAIISCIPDSGLIEKFEIAGPGFINIFLKQGSQFEVINKILHDESAYGKSRIGQNQKIHLEFVSANPTGPLHVGHGRGAAYGATLANLLREASYNVHCEYYVNDAGRQMDILASSIWLRYLELCDIEIPFPVNAYKGDYIWDIAASLHREHGEAFKHDAQQVLQNVSPDETEGGDKEKHIDDIIRNAHSLLGETGFRTVLDQGLKEITGNIRTDLEEFGVHYDNWFSEKSLMDSGAIDKAIQALDAAGYLYKKNGATWFRSSEFGDEKDRVVVRDNGLKTYLASDIAYHIQKLETGADQIIDIWGADHHGYVPRVKASMLALGQPADKLTVLLVQFAILYRGGKRAQMSTRSGEFVTLRELREEVGNDAARFFYVLRKSEQHMDFDLDLAKSSSRDNPVYYIQYAHARICRMMRKLEEKGMVWDQKMGQQHLDQLDHEQELAIVQRLGQYPHMIEKAAIAFEPHQIAYYLRDLANLFHSYYNAKNIKKILEEAPDRRNARVNLSLAVRQVIRNGLTLLGVSAPDSM